MEMEKMKIDSMFIVGESGELIQIQEEPTDRKIFLKAAKSNRYKNTPREAELIRLNIEIFRKCILTLNAKIKQCETFIHPEIKRVEYIFRDYQDDRYGFGIDFNNPKSNLESKKEEIYIRKTDQEIALYKIIFFGKKTDDEKNDAQKIYHQKKDELLNEKIFKLTY